MHKTPQYLWSKTIIIWKEKNRENKKHRRFTHLHLHFDETKMIMPLTMNQVYLELAFTGFNNENKWFDSDVLKTLCKWTKFYSKYKHSNQIQQRWHDTIRLKWMYMMRKKVIFEIIFIRYLLDSIFSLFFRSEIDNFQHLFHLINSNGPNICKYVIKNGGIVWKTSILPKMSNPVSHHFLSLFTRNYKFNNSTETKKNGFVPKVFVQCLFCL